MRIAMITFIIIIAAALIGQIRGDAEFPISHILPFMGGNPPDFWFDGGALVLIVITAWGIKRLGRRGKR